MFNIKLLIYSSIEMYPEQKILLLKSALIDIKCLRFNFKCRS